MVSCKAHHVSPGSVLRYFPHLLMQGELRLIHPLVVAGILVVWDLHRAELQRNSLDSRYQVVQPSGVRDLPVPRLVEENYLVARDKSNYRAKKVCCQGVGP
jgi:hypothetical protein